MPDATRTGEARTALQISLTEAMKNSPASTADLSGHEAWNRSDQTRIVLLFDFLRPGHETSAPDEAPPEVREFIQQRTGRAADTS